MKQLYLHGIGGPATGLIVDLFAGGGGASTGIEAALGRPPDIAINHDPAAIRMHEANHPGTRHLCESIFDVDPIATTQGQPVALLWASPSCTHFSRARGGTPVSKQLRGLGWVVLRWAGKVRPAVIHCENVGEWQTWGPVRRGRPWAKRKGAYFRLFVSSLERMGYAVEWRILDAADYGAGTHRRRLFLTARCDGGAVATPAPTHGPKRSKPYVTAADAIDWSDLGRSIFDRKKPLAPATCRRIAAGIVRYVLQGKPFLVSCAHGDFPTRNGARCHSVDDPLGIVTGSNNHAVVSPTLVPAIPSYEEWIAQTGHLGGTREEYDRLMEDTVVAPTLVQTGYGERAGQAPRALDIKAPLGAVVAGGCKHALVSAFLAKHYGGVVGQEMGKPLGTVTAVDHHSLVACHLTKFRQNAVGSGFADPMPTITSGAGAARPAGAAHALGMVAAHLTTIDQQSNRAGHADPSEPLSAVTSKARHALCAAFLTQYHGDGGQHSKVSDPLPVVTTVAGHAMVVVDIDGTTYALADIRLRMLKPAELARAQGFPTSYILTGTQAEQIGRIGNSVCPPVAAALVAANLPAQQAGVA